MERKQQQLINYHTTGTTMPKATHVQLGEIVVRHNNDRPELLIKKDNDEFATFVDSGKVNTMINDEISKVNATATDAAEKIQGLDVKIKAFSAKVVTDYAISAVVNTQIDTVYTSAATKGTNDAKTYTNTASGNIETAINALSTSLTDKIEANTKKIEDANTALTQTLNGYYKKTETYNQTEIDDKIAAAKTAAKQDAATYTDEQVGNLEDIVNGQIGTLDNRCLSTQNKVEKNESDIKALSGSVESFSSDVKTYIDTKVSAVYRPAGSVATYAQLPTTGVTEGDVYNVVAANGTIGTANYVPAGTNYVYTKNGDWDPLGGTVDLSSYATVALVDTEIGKVNGKITTANDKITANESNITALKAATGTNATAITQAKKAAVTSVVLATNGDAKVTISTTNGASETGKTVTFDFSKMVIDCGSF